MMLFPVGQLILASSVRVRVRFKTGLFCKEKLLFGIFKVQSVLIDDYVKDSGPGEV